MEVAYHAAEGTRGLARAVEVYERSVQLASERGDTYATALAQGTRGFAAGTVVVNGLVPLSELNGYASRLKSVTGGQGSYSMELSHYDPVPPNLQQQLANDYKATRKQEEE